MAPRNITPGTEWGAEIVNAIGTSKVLVLIFSAAANQSPKVLREVERAVAKNIVIIPFRIEDIIPTKSMEYFLSATHWLNAFQGRPENHFATLIKTVTQQLSLSPPVSTNPSGGYNRKHYLPYLVPAVVLLLIAAASGTLLFHKTDSRQRSTQNRITNGIAAKKVLQLNPSMVPEKTHVTPRTNVHPVVPPAAPSVAPIPLQTGDYLRFGKYYDAPILWRVVRVQNGTALLISTHILTLKPFDAAESGSYDHNGAGLVFDENKPWNEVVTAYTAADLRKMKGSNNWISANIREWLNSSSAPVRYSTQPPTQQAVAGGANSYASEPGFLYYFTPAERNLIHKAKHKVLLPTLDQQQKTGGATPFAHQQAAQVSRTLNNYQQAYFTLVSDRVFLPSIEDLHYLETLGWEIKARLTPQAIAHDNSAYRKSSWSLDKDYLWWLSTPDAAFPANVCIVGNGSFDYKDAVYSTFASDTYVGVRPMLYLATAALTLEGAGTGDEPYRLAASFK